MAASIGLGCASLPDLGPYTEATAEIGSGVRKAGAAVDAEIERLAAPILIPYDAADEKARTAEYEKARSNLSAEWGRVVAAVDAVTAYSASLESVYSAGRAGAESVEKVTAAASGLADKLFGGAAPVITDAANDVIASIYKAIANARAAKKLQASMESMAVAVNEMAAELDRALATLEELLQPGVLELALRNRAVERYQIEFKLDLGQRAAVLDARESALGQFVQKLSETPPADPTALANHRAELAALQTRVEQLDLVLEASESAYAAYTAEIEEIRARFKQQRHAVAATRRAVAEWAKVHAQLAEQLGEKRVPDIAVLVQLGQQIDAAVESYR